MLTALIEDATELVTLTPQSIPEDAEDETAPAYRGGPYVHVPRTGIPTLPVYSAEECATDAVLAQIEEPDAARISAALNAAMTTPDAVFDICMYSIEPRWPTSFRESEFKCSRWLVAARALEGTGLWPRYVAAEKAAENGTQSADMELRETLGKAWRAAGLHQISKHLRPSRHRHHSERPKVRQQRVRRAQPQEDTRIRLWLCPEVKEQRAAEQGGGILRGTLR
ncbi:MAG TPA: hypothetical protein VGK01_11945 [Candidatus Angelobacter sp.]|jgi:hypothetical protein